jgi:quinone-modifying oxidoreductase subunit QmoC
MASIPVINTSSEFREAFAARGGDLANRCYQCATCTSVCELSPDDAPFPRRQVLWAQWGLADRLISDPGPWLCHQCNDCSVRCPREVNPGDMMGAVRSMTVEKLSVPQVLGRLTGNIRTSWPALIFVPIIFWVVLLGVTTGFHTPEEMLPFSMDGRFHYEELVPHSLIYIVYTSVTLWVVGAMWFSGRKFWQLMGSRQERSGSFLGALTGTVVDIATHKKFSSCDHGVPKRRWGHFLVMWGFVGAAVTSGILVVYLYKDTPFFSWIPVGDASYPLPLDHWVKWLGNISAVALVIGGILLFVNRLNTTDKLVGRTTPFDRFFLMTVLGVIGTGVLTEGFRFVAVPVEVAYATYILHLGAVLTLFITVPYSKFAHILYRTLAMTHERMTTK